MGQVVCVAEWEKEFLTDAARSHALPGVASPAGVAAGIVEASARAGRPESLKIEALRLLVAAVVSRLAGPVRREIKRNE